LKAIAKLQLLLGQFSAYFFSSFLVCHISSIKTIEIEAAAQGPKKEAKKKKLKRNHINIHIISKPVCT